MDLSPERELLLACASSKLTPEERRRIADVAGGDLDWERLVSLSYAHGIAPLVYHSLQQSAVNHRMPPAVARALRDSYYLNAARNSLLYSELTRVLNVLSDQSIEVIVLKGAALAEAVYSHRALRPMSDIDLLVKRERLAEVETTLLDIGYALDAGMKEHHYHFAFTKSAAPAVEIHWHVQGPTDPFRVDIDGCWRRAESITLPGVEALVLSPEDLVLHLCQHMHKHNLLGGIRPLCDIAETIKCYGDGIVWTKIASFSSEWGMNAGSYLVLSLARELLDAPVPEDFLSDIKPVNFNMEVINWAREAVLGYGECPLIFPDLVRLFWRSGSTKERWAILQKILSRETVAGYANDSSVSKRAYVYYPLRMKHLLTRYGPTVGRLWAGERRIRAAAETEEKQQRLTKWLTSSGNQ